jgi:hypothetical protein
VPLAARGPIDRAPLAATLQNNQSISQAMID